MKLAGTKLSVTYKQMSNLLKQETQDFYAATSIDDMLCMPRIPYDMRYLKDWTHLHL